MTITKAINNVYKKLSELSKKEFEKELKKHKDGDFAKMVLETGFLFNKLNKEK